MLHKLTRPRLTLTGVDEQTDLKALQRLGDEWPGVEFAVLWSETNKAPRYPSGGWIAQTLQLWGTWHKDEQECPETRPLAVHICGGTARNVFLGLEPARSAVNVGIFVRAYAGRIQINGFPGFGDFDLMQVGRATGYYAGEVITQTRWDPLIPDMTVQRDFFCPNEAFLMDQSGGRGRTPSAWVMPPKSVVGDCPVGFAGGLSAENVGEHLPKILEVALDHSVDERSPSRVWIDMESSLRVEDRFSIERVQKTIEAVEAVMPGWLK